MTAQALLDLMLPAYSPCPHFDGACADACTWQPDRGIVPCGFGGATGALDDVRLVIVTAEPGDPPRDAHYRGDATDMLLLSLRIFTEPCSAVGWIGPADQRHFIETCDTSSIASFRVRIWYSN
ncbi:hypothetical protein [Roseovarius dicentrarchi]|uniref:hypothetical protein n=1 Tax=Roseovarius dicentrarchi TaxID=2250573 RepID=UPI0013966910|nr:hypothetical protein [Roseovarius dicentrarchi]